MHIEYVEVVEVEESRRYSLAEVARAAGFSEAQAALLAEFGLLGPALAEGSHPGFGGAGLQAARCASRLMAGLEIDIAGAAVAASLALRVRELERELAQLRARGERSKQ